MLNFKLFPITKNKIIYFGITIGLFVIICSFGWLYYQYSQSKADAARLRELSKSGSTEEVEKVVTAIGQYMELPTNEKPTVATITDKEKLTEQSFFANAENGDKVLIYPQTKKAILYRPGTNKIIEVSTVNIGQGQNSSTSSASPRPSQP